MLSGRDSSCSRGKKVNTLPAGRKCPPTPPQPRKRRPPSQPPFSTVQTRLHLRNDRSRTGSTKQQDSGGGSEDQSSQEKAIELRNRCSDGRVSVYSSAATASAPSSSSLSISMPMSSVVLSPCISMSFTTVRRERLTSSSLGDIRSCRTSSHVGNGRASHGLLTTEHRISRARAERNAEFHTQPSAPGQPFSIKQNQTKARRQIHTREVCIAPAQCASAVHIQTSAMHALHQGMQRTSQPHFETRRAGRSTPTNCLQS